MSPEFLHEGDSKPDGGDLPAENPGDSRETELRMGETAQAEPGGPVDRPITSGMMQPIEGATEPAAESTEDDRPPEGATTKEIADFYGIELDVLREHSLVVLRINALRAAYGDDTAVFNLDHPKGLGISLREAGDTAICDFMPRGDLNPSDDSLARLEATRDFIDAAHDAGLLFESDRLPKPGAFAGKTNLSMARFLAKRFGFEVSVLPKRNPEDANEEQYAYVAADYETVRKHLTSPKLIKTRDLLDRRIKSYDT